MSQRVTGFYDTALEPAGISVTQYSLLANIWRMPGCGTGQLAQRVRLERSTLVRTLQPLLSQGFIVDKAPGGSRKRQLHLSPLGEEIYAKAVPLWQQAQTNVKLHLGESYEALWHIFTQIDTLE
ncbi:MAG: MarR family winged helix-turn-helix transcriptional regulator [Desulfovibrio sp.]|uniref:MarR family winged helix-turn-helix transcriptional regulator n=1 Tax=Desulfovibrio sp. TaxID=885 RepID=UPI0039E56362